MYGGWWNKIPNEIHFSLTLNSLKNEKYIKQTLITGFKCQQTLIWICAFVVRLQHIFGVFRKNLYFENSAHLAALASLFRVLR